MDQDQKLLAHAQLANDEARVISSTAATVAKIALSLVQMDTGKQFPFDELLKNYRTAFTVVNSCIKSQM